MTAQLLAAAELLRVAKALATLPDCIGTVDAICTASGLTRARVARRLRGGSTHPYKFAVRYFEVVERPNSNGRSTTTWKLTSHGATLARGEK